MNFDDIRLLDEEIDPSTIKPYDWDLVINGVPYYVCRIPDHCHSVKWHNGQETRQCLWCYPRDKKPTRDNLVEYDLPCPVAWGLEYREKRYIKFKWDEAETRNGAATIITRNGKPFYTVSGDLMYSIPKALTLINEIVEHPLEFNTIDYDKNMIGRKIWYRSQPGIISRFVAGQCCVMVEPDGFDDWTVPAEFRSEEDYYDDSTAELKIDCLEDKNVWWFREQETNKGE